jgi:anti-anti-sigma regulatory factor
MVFSFFKKPPQKMVARPAATPRPRERTAAEPAAASEDGASGPAFDKSVPLEFTPSPTGTGASSPQDSGRKGDSVLDFTDSEFGASQLTFEVEDHADPLAAEAEETAVLFANGQDEMAREVLENAVKVYKSGPGERLWRMLFDFYRLTGKKAAFEALGIEYARSFEKSPPAWRDRSSKSAQKSREVAAGSMLFRGELIGDNETAFAAVLPALEKNPRLRLDLSKIKRIDAAGCGRLLALLQQARKARREIELLGRDALAVLVQEHVVPGKPEDQECWLLFLELCQLQGQSEAFENLAVDYAVTFEVSPPSWEAARVAAPEPVPTTVNGASDGEELDAYVMRGEIKGARFGDLPAFAQVHDPVLIDCSSLTRIDFVSAGALLNVLSTVRQQGRQIVFRHPNHLVAELFGVVGLTSVATIEFEKH